MSNNEADGRQDKDRGGPGEPLVVPDAAVSGDSVIPAGMEWNESILTADHELNGLMVNLLAFPPTGPPRPVGTGFIFVSLGETAVCFTAAHVLLEAGHVQSVERRSHPSALREFLPDGDPVQIDSRSLRLVHIKGRQITVLTVDWAILCERTDIAVLGVSTPDRDPTYFAKDLVFALPPAVGEPVAVLGFSEMKVHDFERDGESERFALSRRLTLRVGRVTHLHPEGHVYSRGPCLETSIPVYPGMSGSPVLEWGVSDQIRVCGVLSSDPDREDEDRRNRLVDGSSIAALLPATAAQDPDTIRIELRDAIALGPLPSRTEES